MTVPAAPELPGVLGAWSFEPVTVGRPGVGRRGLRVGLPGGPAAHAPPPGARLAAVGVLRRPGAWWRSPSSRRWTPTPTPCSRSTWPSTCCSPWWPRPSCCSGEPGTLALRVVSPERRRRWLRVGHGRAVRLASSPLLAWTVFAAAGWVIHFSPLFDAALRSRPVHVAEHALFLATALLFWWPVVGGHPGAARCPTPSACSTWAWPCPRTRSWPSPSSAPTGSSTPTTPSWPAPGARRRWPTSARAPASCGWPAT